MHNRVIRTLAAACVAPSIVILAATSIAQTSDTEVFVLDPFTVSGITEENYRAQTSAAGLGFVVDNSKLPIPVNILTSQFLQDTNSIKVEDALRYVSGTSNAGRSHKEEEYVLRGFATEALLRNGERFNLPTDSALIDRIEVLKGPAAIIYGTAGPAGLVNTVTKKPFFARESKVTLGWDEYGSYRGVLDVNMPIETGKDGFRLATRLIVAKNRDQFDRPLEFRDRDLISPSFHAEIGSNTIVEMTYHHTDEDGRLNRIQTPFNRTSDPTLFAVGFVPVARDFSFVTPHDSWDLKSRGYEFRLVQHLSDDLTLQVGYADTSIERAQYFNIANGRISPNASGQYFAGNNRMVYEPAEVDHRGVSAKLLYELQTGEVTHKINFGFRDNKDRNYEWAFFDANVVANSPPQLIADNNGPVAGIFFPGHPRTVSSLSDPGATAITGTTSKTNPNPVTVKSYYLTDYISMMDSKLNILLGAQYIDIVTQNRSSFAPQVGLTYEFLPGWNAYALHSKTFAPNGPASTVNPALGFLEPEEGVGNEFGIKFAPAEGKLSGQLSFFEIKRENIIEFKGGVFDENNNKASGEETSEGIELDFVYTPFDGLSIMGGYAYTDAYISKKDIDGSNDSPDLNGDGISDAIGLRKEGVAKHDIRLWSSYRFADDTSLGGLSFGGGMTWRQGPIQQMTTYSQRFVREEGDPFRVDLFAAYRTEIGGKPTRFQINWQNANNNTYRDRRAFFVTTSTISLTADMTF